MSWLITIDQQVGGGIHPRASQRYGPFKGIDDQLAGAIEDALSLAGLDLVSEGAYQITCVPEKSV